jgi:hypothetical protein
VWVGLGVLVFRDHNKELQQGLRELFGEGFCGLTMNYTHHCQPVYSMGAFSPVGHTNVSTITSIVINVRFGYLEFVMDLDRSYLARLLYSFNFSEKYPVRETTRYYEAMSTGMVITAHYSTDDLDGFTDEVVRLGREKIEKEFYDSVDKVLIND